MRMDPIVAEVRAVRDRLAAECGNDLREMFRQIREYQAKSGLRYVRYPPRRMQEPEEVRKSDTAVAEKPESECRSRME